MMWQQASKVAEHLFLMFFGLGLCAQVLAVVELEKASSASASNNVWLPRSLGSFPLKDAGFIEAYQTHPEADNYSDRYTLYLTTFNFGKIQDPLTSTMDFVHNF